MLDKKIIELIKDSKFNLKLTDINGTIESSFFDSDKEQILYVYDMAEATTMKQGGLLGIHEIILNIKSFKHDVIRSTIIKVEGKELTILTDVNYSTLVGIYDMNL